MPSAEKQDSAGEDRVFIRGPASRIKEDLNKRIRAETIRTRRLQKITSAVRKRTQFLSTRTELCSLF